jgi:hypothetical protein
VREQFKEVQALLGSEPGKSGDAVVKVIERRGLLSE